MSLGKTGNGWPRSCGPSTRHRRWRLPELRWRRLPNTGEEWYPAIVPGWERNWERLTPFFDYPPEIRKVVYTNNAIEPLNYSLWKIIKGRGEAY